MVLSMTLGRVKQSWRLNEWSATHSLLSGHSRRSALRPHAEDSRYCLGTPGGVHSCLSRMTLKQKDSLRPGPNKERGRSARNDATLRNAMLLSILLLQK